ncbi:ribosome recycling factor domain-containing protein [Amanita rubescens]|nr:ribosome recycling factor domain-containing protein [Amanita rubescens]
MLSPLRLTHLLYPRQSVNYALSRGKDKSGNDSTKESKLKEKLISTASLVPGSQKPIVNEAAREEYAKTESTMRTPVEWFRKECTEAESRANGRITPALLKPVRVKMDDVDGAVGLEQVATVGIRDGTTLIVTVFDEQTTKEVERAIYDAKIPHVVPQRFDKRTIKIPIPKPTVETRIAEYTAQHKKAEDIRVQIRKVFQASVKRGKYGKHSVELAEFQKLSDRYISEVDQILTTLKKATGAK